MRFDFIPEIYIQLTVTPTNVMGIAPVHTFDQERPNASFTRSLYSESPSAFKVPQSIVDPPYISSAGLTARGFKALKLQSVF